MLPLTAVENAAIALAFFAISGLIFVGLAKDRALGLSPLGVATALVFLTCASGHAFHAVRYLIMPEIHGDDTLLSVQLLVDGLTLAAALGYFAQRRRYGLVIRGTHPMLDYQRRLQMAEALGEIGQDIAAQTDPDSLLQRVVHHSRNLLAADYAAIVAMDASGKSNRQASGTRTDGWDDDAWSNAVFLSDGDGHGSVPASRRPIVVDNLPARGAAAAGRPTIHRAEGGRSALAVPIFRGDVVAGSLMVAYRSARRLTQDDVSSAAALAGQAAVAIEKARLIESLRQADRLKDEFLSAAAHELRTPVTTIKGWTEILLRDNHRTPVDVRKGLETIHRQTQRITRLSEDLAAAMCLQPGVPAVARERFDLSALVLECVETARRMDGRRQFRVEAAGPLVVEADRRLIGEVVGRLLENALRYSTVDKPIEIEARRIDGESVVSVRDHGTGIPLERQPHVFDAFFEPVPPGREGYVGTVSLGLYLSKQIVDAHGGRIWFTSVPGEGSTFYFGLR